MIGKPNTKNRWNFIFLLAIIFVVVPTAGHGDYYIILPSFVKSIFWGGEVQSSFTLLQLETRFWETKY